ncbi:MAG TPA: amino acid transporter [Lentisphaeria bacterium]|nr:MAG: amino acid transporter [Lentisphaerae bacterium GWF2_50_93]HCE44640.1 amino acid transporter [Lentisphaeria bacterium]
MDTLTLIGTAAFLNLLAAISPGPDFVMAVRNSLNYSRRTGIFTGFGIGLGLAVHIIYCAAGVGYIIAKSIVVFNIIKYLGAAYLIYMGIRSLMAHRTKIEIETKKESQDLTRMQAVKIGFLTNVLNPKATMFFLGLFTFVIRPDTPAYVIVIISFIMIMTAITWFTIVAIFFTQKRIQDAYARFENVINRAFGALLIFLGVKIALAQR